MSIKYLKKLAGVDAPVRVDVAPVFGEVSTTSDYFLNGLWYDSTGTAYNPQPTYLNYNGKLVGFEVADGDVVDLHYDIDYPKIVEGVTQVDTMIADVYKGKNACTAWVNFDGTTTPPTIKDSFNVSDIVRTATGKFRIYNNFDNTNYAIGCISSNGTLTDGGDFMPIAITAKTTTYFDIIVGRGSDVYNLTNPKDCGLIIFGGKN